MGHKLDITSEITRILRSSVACKEIPGAVCVVGTSRSILVRTVVGWRMLTPERRAMRADTLFDLASLTKVICTTPCVMKLVGEGHIKITDSVGRFFREFRRGVRRRVTIEHLLLHTSGLPACRDYWRNAGDRNAILTQCLDEPLVHSPGESFTYSDLGFLLLGEIVQRVVRQPLCDFAAKNIFAPAGMNSTFFNPPQCLWRDCAATERTGGLTLCGQVHDENARAMGGVSGHAGLFSTADDLVRFCQLLLLHRNERLIRTMIQPRPVSGGFQRALGWDVSSPNSSPRGHLFGPRSFGHTGFTGCSLWLDPALDTFVILLTNRVHISREVNINPLRSKIGTLAALAAILEQHRAIIV